MRTQRVSKSVCQVLSKCLAAFHRQVWCRLWLIVLAGFSQTVWAQEPVATSTPAPSAETQQSTSNTTSLQDVVKYHKMRVEEVAAAIKLWNSLHVKKPGFYYANGWFYVYVRDKKQMYAVSQIAQYLFKLKPTPSQDEVQQIMQVGSLTCKSPVNSDLVHCLFIFKKD